MENKEILLMIKESLSEIKSDQRSNQENTDHRLRELELGLNTVEASFNTARAIGGAIMALLAILVGIQLNWSCQPPTKRAAAHGHTHHAATAPHLPTPPPARRPAAR